jgi:hypothetical protein
MGIFGGGGGGSVDTGPSIAAVEKGQKAGYAAIDKYYPIAQNYLQGAINTAQANVAPYSLLGSNAMDMYADTLGIPRSAASSYELQQALLSSPALAQQAASTATPAAQSAAAQQASTSQYPVYQQPKLAPFRDLQKLLLTPASIQQQAANTTAAPQTAPVPQGTTAQQALANQYRSGTLGMQVTPADTVLSRFQQSPGYQFAMQQGLQALDRSAASKGLTGSGAALKGVTEYAQGIANQEFGNYQGRLAQMAGMGANAAQIASNAALQGGAAQAETASNAGASIGNISTSSASNIANINMGAQQAAAQQQSSNNSLFGSILGTGASLLGGFL